MMSFQANFTPIMRYSMLSDKSSKAFSLFSRVPSVRVISSSVADHGYFSPHQRNINLCNRASLAHSISLEKITKISDPFVRNGTRGADYKENSHSKGARPLLWCLLGFSVKEFLGTSDEDKEEKEGDSQLVLMIKRGILAFYVSYLQSVIFSCSFLYHSSLMEPYFN